MKRSMYVNTRSFHLAISSYIQSYMQTDAEFPYHKAIVIFLPSLVQRPYESVNIKLVHFSSNACHLWYFIFMMMTISPQTNYIWKSCTPITTNGDNKTSRSMLYKNINLFISLYNRLILSDNCVILPDNCLTTIVSYWQLFHTVWLESWLHSCMHTACANYNLQQDSDNKQITIQNAIQQIQLSDTVYNKYNCLKYTLQ